MTPERQFILVMEGMDNPPFCPRRLKKKARQRQERSARRGAKRREGAIYR